ncbi:hypothetical protein KIPB_003127 [Kipferlia bialata]|uniref:Uncharacterized protein n=1 Tax=Kipferlia bialata TaxID=797122 RepID=A0A9K3CRT9_9EUKA|nr:hypothetical protein KIPB_003127 [Kipferlia bialata]|eukprot:g3127.t1
MTATPWDCHSLGAWVMHRDRAVASAACTMCVHVMRVYPEADMVHILQSDSALTRVLLRDRQMAWGTSAVAGMEFPEAPGTSTASHDVSVLAAKVHSLGTRVSDVEGSVDKSVTALQSDLSLVTSVNDRLAQAVQRLPGVDERLLALQEDVGSMKHSQSGVGIDKPTQSLTASLTIERDLALLKLGAEEMKETLKEATSRTDALSATIEEVREQGSVSFSYAIEQGNVLSREINAHEQRLTELKDLSTGGSGQSRVEEMIKDLEGLMAQVPRY